jgi:hypothetical protein
LSQPTFLPSQTDEVVAYAPIRPYYLQQCEKGSKIHLVTPSGLTHTETYLYSLGDAYAFMESAFDGTIALTGCKATNEFERSLLSSEFDEAIGSLASTALTSYVSSSLSSSSSSSRRVRL